MEEIIMLLLFAIVAAIPAIAYFGAKSINKKAVAQFGVPLLDKTVVGITVAILLGYIVPMLVTGGGPNTGIPYFTALGVWALLSLLGYVAIFRRTRKVAGKKWAIGITAFALMMPAFYALGIVGVAGVAVVGGRMLLLKLGIIKKPAPDSGESTMGRISRESDEANKATTYRTQSGRWTGNPAAEKEAVYDGFGKRVN